MDAPSLILPKGVAFNVGKNSPMKYLVLQVHYASAQPFAGKKLNLSNKVKVLLGYIPN